MAFLSAFLFPANWMRSAPSRLQAAPSDNTISFSQGKVLHAGPWRFFGGDALGCNIITAPAGILRKLEPLGKDPGVFFRDGAGIR